MTVQPHSEMLVLSFQELTAIAESLGEPRYRAGQLYHALYRTPAGQLEEVSTLPKGLRQKLAAQGLVFGKPAIQQQFTSTDGTIRYLISFADGESVETVWMPEGDGGEVDDGSEAGREELMSEPGSRGFNRATICVSSQVGCAVNCQFCLTALLGVKRNLHAGEIVGQVLAVLKDRKVKVEKQRLNLVFMGMGEPFLNYENFIKAVTLLVEGVGIPASRMTVSTAGIVPRIYDLGKETV